MDVLEDPAPQVPESPASAPAPLPTPANPPTPAISVPCPGCAKRGIPPSTALVKKKKPRLNTKEWKLALALIKLAHQDHPKEAPETVTKLINKMSGWP